MKALWLSMLLLACLPAYAAEDADAGKDSLQILVDQQQALKADLEDGGIDGLSARQNRIVREAQTEFFTLTQGKSKLDDLSMDEKIRLENALERINAEVKNTRVASDEQNVCWRERVSGSSRKTTRCGTKAEMREAREGARDFLERPKVCGDNCGGL